MIRNTLILFFLFAVLLIYNSCEIIDPSEKIPSYIQIDTIDINTYSGQGTASHNIVDAWVYINDQLIGVYELPAKIPILEEGNNKLSIRAGIKVNGIASTRAVYPFYEIIKQDINLVSDSIIILQNLSTKYYDSNEFPWVIGNGQEDFEQQGVSIETATNSDTNMVATSDEVFEGNQSGVISLIDSLDSYLGTSIVSFSPPGASESVFLELNYKSDIAFQVGVYVNAFSGSLIKKNILIVNKSDGWNKIYINLGQTLRREIGLSGYKVFIEVLKPSDITSSNTYFDNIKLVHN